MRLSDAVAAAAVDRRGNKSSAAACERHHEIGLQQCADRLII